MAFNQENRGWPTVQSPSFPDPGLVQSLPQPQSHSHLNSPLQSQIPGFHPSQIWNPTLRSGVGASQSSSSIPGIMAAPRRSLLKSTVRSMDPTTDNMLEFDPNNQLRKAGGQLPRPLLPSQHPIHLDSPSEKAYGSQPRRPILGSNLGSLPSIISASGTTAGPRRSSPIPLVHAKAPTGAKTCQSNSRKSPPDAQEKKKQNRKPAPLRESRLCTELLEFEARIDAEAARKAKAIQEVVCGDLSKHRMLRIYIFNTFSNQAHRTAEPDNAEPPSWSLKITGRILEDEITPDPEKGSQKPKPLYPKFSSFFKKIVVKLDEHLYPDDPVIIWESSRSAAPVEGFEIKRKGDKEFTAIILLEMSFVPEEFRLSPSLKEVLGIDFDTRPRIIASLFNYVKRKRLQNPGDPTEFVCDAPLKRVFGENTKKFATVRHEISQQLLAMPPIEIRHDIRLSGNAPGIDTCYDVLAKVPGPQKKEVQINLYENKEMMEFCDKVINTCLKEIHERHKRRAFLLRFSQSPGEFIHEMIASQSGNLNTIEGKATRKRLADHYNQPWAEDAVIRYLGNNLALENDSSENNEQQSPSEEQDQTDGS